MLPFCCSFFLFVPLHLIYLLLVAVAVVVLMLLVDGGGEQGAAGEEFTRFKWFCIQKAPV